MTFEAALKHRADAIGAALDHYLSDLSESQISEGMRYAVSGGKCLRGFLVLETAAMFEEPREAHMLTAAAIECVHAYSLVHDDLPCMDDDDLRRGQPTVHVKWDEATAVLVGDALQSFAFELLSRNQASARLIQSLAQASGANGMLLGQTQDIAAENAASALTLEEITALQQNKTGALIRWSAEAGAILTENDPKPLRGYANALGLAFQIADDILDVTGDETKAGKRLKKDEKVGKATFVSLLGIESAKAKARELVAEAIDELCVYDARADSLRAAARFVISREF